MSLPTRGELLEELRYHVNKAAEAAAKLGHLEVMGEYNRKDKAISDGWISMSMLFDRVLHQISALAQGRLTR